MSYSHTVHIFWKCNFYFCYSIVIFFSSLLSLIFNRTLLSSNNEYYHDYVQQNVLCIRRILYTTKIARSYLYTSEYTFSLNYYIQRFGSIIHTLEYIFWNTLHNYKIRRITDSVQIYSEDASFRKTKTNYECKFLL